MSRGRRGRRERRQNHLAGIVLLVGVVIWARSNVRRRDAQGRLRPVTDYDFAVPEELIRVRDNHGRFVESGDTLPPPFCWLEDAMVSFRPGIDIPRLNAWSVWPDGESE